MLKKQYLVPSTVLEALGKLAHLILPQHHEVALFGISIY